MERWRGWYSYGAMLTEMEKTIQKTGIDPATCTEQQMLDALDDDTLLKIYSVGTLSVTKCMKGCNVNALPHSRALLKGILGHTQANPSTRAITSKQQAQLMSWGLYEQMKFMRYLSSVHELFHGTLAEIQTEIWEGYQKLEKEKSAEAVRQLLLEEETKPQPVKKGAKKSSQTTTTTTTTTTQPKQVKQQAPAQNKKAPPANSAHQQALNTLNTPVIKSRIKCENRVLRWRGATLGQIRDTFVDKKGEELVKQYAMLTDEELKYQQQVHNIPMERILSIPDLETKYSCSYSFTVNGFQRAGRCFCAIKQNGQATETGLIRVAIDNQTRKIYHIMFEKRDNINLAQLTQNVDHTENVVVEDAQWEQTNKYMFKMDGDAIMISIQNLKSKEITTYKILPLS